MCHNFMRNVMRRKCHVRWLRFYFKRMLITGLDKQTLHLLNYRPMSEVLRGGSRKHKPQIIKSNNFNKILIIMGPVNDKSLGHSAKVPFYDKNKDLNSHLAEFFFSLPYLQIKVQNATVQIMMIIKLHLIQQQISEAKKVFLNMLLFTCSKFCFFCNNNKNIFGALKKAKQMLILTFFRYIL